MTWKGKRRKIGNSRKEMLKEKRKEFTRNE
jgi:hypothetical protein